MSPDPHARPGSLRLRPAGDQAGFDLASPRLIIAGYTGRDAAAVAEHIDELAAIGVAPPASVPAFYDMDPGLLTTDPVVEISGANTSGEVEPVLIRHGGQFFLGVGSDHTDRDRERDDVAASKAACPKPLSDQVVPVPADLADVPWDAITVESAVDGTPYQRGRLDALRTPTDLLSRLTETLGEIHGDLVLFAGTLPLLGGQFLPGARWQLSMTVGPDTTLTHTYEAKRRAA